MDAYNRGAPSLPGQETGAAPARWSPLGGIDPDETKTAPQPAIRTRRATPGRLPAHLADPDDTKTAPQPAIRIPHLPEARPAAASAPPRSDPAPPAARPARHDDDHGVVPGMRRRAPADPSWLRVLVTTVGLWLQRRSPGNRASQRRRINWSYWLRATALALVVLLAAGAGVLLSRQGHKHKPAAASPVRTAQAIRAEAASWVVSQVSQAASVYCDPQMCQVLTQHNFPPSNVVPMGQGNMDPIGSQVVVATGQVRSQLGSRLETEYAPLVLAQFGSGSDAIQIRQEAADGAKAFQAQLAADMAARRTDGSKLASRDRVAATPAVRRALTGGQVDPRLLVVLSFLSDTDPLRILSFGAAAPGAAAGSPLRSATIVPGLSPAGDTSAALSTLVKDLRNQQQPYLPALQIVRLPTGGRTVRVQFDAPTPLGLINTTQSEAGGADTHSPSRS